MTPPNGTEHRAIVDTHRHPIRPKLQAKMAERGLRAAVEMCGVDRVVFGSDYGAVPYGIEEHVQIVEEVLPNPAEREQVFWKTSNRVFRLGLSDTISSSFKSSVERLAFR